MVAIFLGVFAAGRIVRPIEELAATAERIAAGDFSQQVAISNQDEIGALGVAFNTMASQVRSLIDNLEQRVYQRTRALETSNQVSARLSTILDTGQLVQEVVTQLQQAFNYYHVHVYLLDETSGQLKMTGGTGEAGRILLEQGHAIEMGKGLVGQAAASNAPTFVADVTKDDQWLPNPLLPETQAEAAVPIAVGSQVLGVLDIQQNVIGGLTEESVELMQSIANQLAIALRNATLYAETEKRARRENMLRTINQEIASTTDVETAMKVAIRELGQALGAPQTAVRLITPEDGRLPRNGRVSTAPLSPATDLENPQ